jgi:two-component system nitrogen regulation sensor histidine kinase GlnL
MGKTARRPTTAARLDPVPQYDTGAILGMLPTPVVVVDGEDRVHFVNLEAQQFFDSGESVMLGQPLDGLVPPDSPIFDMLRQVRAQGATVADYGIVLETPRIGRRNVMVAAGPIADPLDHVTLVLFPESVARRIDNQLVHRHSTRSVAAMAAALAHEVKNPLSGIRGAAQLLEQTVGDEDRALTQLICQEADRIVRLVERIDVFADLGPPEHEAINIHAVLDRARAVGEAGFARHVRIVERYDPSLPAVSGNFDQLVQIFLNLIKNAAEAVSPEGGEIVLTTAYQQGVRIALAGRADRINLPILVTVQDNGPGIPEELRDHLFDPFVTTKSNGTGLGLPIVAKIVGDHGGIVEIETGTRRTVFRVRLPLGEERA